MCAGLHVKCSFFAPILTKFEFYRENFIRIISLKFHKISAVGAELFHADRRVDRQT